MSTEKTPLLMRHLRADAQHPGANEVDGEEFGILRRGPQRLVDAVVEATFPLFSSGQEFWVGDADLSGQVDDAWIRSYGATNSAGWNAPRQWSSLVEWRRDQRVMLQDLSNTWDRRNASKRVKLGVTGLKNLAGRAIKMVSGPTRQSRSASVQGTIAGDVGDTPHDRFNYTSDGRRIPRPAVETGLPGQAGFISVARGDSSDRMAASKVVAEDLRRQRPLGAVGSIESLGSTPRAEDFIKSRFRKRGRWTWAVQSQLNRRLEALGDAVKDGGKTSPSSVAQWFEQVFGSEVKPVGVRAVKMSNVDGVSVDKDGVKSVVPAPVDVLVSVRVVGEAEELLVSLDLVAMLVNYMAFRPRHRGTLALLRVKALAFAKKLELNQRYMSVVIHGSVVLGMLVPQSEVDSFGAMEGAAGEAIIGWSERLNRGLLRDRSLLHRLQEWVVWGANRAVWGLTGWLILEQLGFWELAGHSISSAWAWAWSVLGLSMPAIHIAWYVYLGVFAAILVPVVGGLALWLRPRAQLILPAA